MYNIKIKIRVRNNHCKIILKVFIQAEKESSTTPNKID